jgi:hypothetical protein
MTDRITDLIEVERQARGRIASVPAWAAQRRAALHELHALLGTWEKVADATGQKLPTVHKAASQPRKKKP